MSQYVPIIFIAFILVWYRKRLKQAFKYAVSVLIMFAVALSPWLIRNYHLFGHLAVSSSGSHNLLLEYAVPMETHRRKLDIKTVQNSLLAEAEQMMRADGLQPEKLNSFQKADYYKRLAIRYITGDPVSFMKTYVMGLVHTFINLDTSTFTEKLGISTAKVEMKEYPNMIDLLKDFLTQKGPLGLLTAGLIIPYLIVSYLGLAAGLIISWKRYDKGALICCFLLAAYFVLLTGVAGTARFKMPAIPFYLPFTGIGIVYLWEKIKQRPNTQKNG